MKYLQEEVREKLYRSIKGEYDISPEEIIFSIPPDRKFGCLSTTIPFILAKKKKEKPFLIGSRIIEKIKAELPYFSEIKLAGGGFINFYFKKGFLFKYLIEHKDRKAADKKQKVIVEHTSINPNKAAHIGHLRNACLGDVLVESLRFLGCEVEVQNYLDDTGIQVADVVWGLLHYGLEEIKKIKGLASYLWQLYADVSKQLAGNDQFKEERNKVHQKIEDKIDPEYEISNYISQEVLRDHIRVMDMLGIRYDLLVRESDIIELDFFKSAAEIMLKNRIMYPSADPEKKGCQVIKYKRENIEKIIIRSNNTVTYIGKDIAYSLWKTGLFEKDFYYKKFHTYADRVKDIYITDSQGGKEDFGFGNAQTVYNVIGIRQSYLQNIISEEVIAPLSPGDSQREAIHFSYEMVALTPRCVEELGFKITEEEQKKSHVDVSGRRGIAVKAEDLIGKLIVKSLQEVKLRDPDIEEEKAKKIAREIAVGALRYFMIKFSSKTVIAFDFKDALAFEGDTGPYLQYTLVRINSILRKLESREAFPEKQDLELSLLEENEYGILYEILLYLSLMEAQVELAIKNSEVSVIANYTYTLCQKANHYYHLFPIIAEENQEIKHIRLSLILLVKNKLEKLLALMGIPVPEKM
ncbi:MAG: arginine--tRNA ligase [Candidatus Aminicenantes bacterium]|nr:arginine--tRNA ligase [Candidatus Aminicenantes bacterium]